jgi:anti-sigma-K factor RskA
MTPDHDVHSDVEAYVLGALDDSERTAFENHLAECLTCPREIASYVPVLHALRQLPLPSYRPLKKGWSSTIPIRPFMTIAAAAILAISALGGTFWQRSETNDMVTAAVMGATSAQSIALRGNGAQGRMIVDGRRERTAFVIEGLPSPGPNRDYQVWINKGTLMSPGILHRTTQGCEVLIVTGDVMRGAQTVTVSLEASGGSPRLVGHPIMVGTAGAA